MDLNIQNEYGKLKKVFMTKMDDTYAALMAPFLGPITKGILKGHAALTEIFSRYGVEGKSFLLSPDQRLAFVRDPFIVIGDKLILAKPVPAQFLKAQKDSALNFFGLKNRNDIIDISDARIIIDGGDVLVHNDTIFVGQNGQRTNLKGLEFIKRHFEDRFNVVPIYLKRDVNGESFLHLDCAFNILSESDAIAYARGVDDRSMSQLLHRFDIVDITPYEQKYLGANVLSIGDGVVVSQKRHERINAELENRGFTVEEADFGDTLVSGGAFRCATCPLERE